MGHTPFIRWMDVYTLIHTIYSYTPKMMWYTRFVCLCIYIHSFTPFILTHHSFVHTEWCDAHYSSVSLFIYTHTHHAFLHTIHSYTPFIRTPRIWYDAHYSSVLESIYTHTHHSFFHTDDDMLHTIHLFMYSYSHTWMFLSPLRTLHTIHFIHTHHSFIYSNTPGCFKSIARHVPLSYTPFIHSYTPFIYL